MNRANREIRRGKFIGALLTICTHALVLIGLGITGLRLVYPPPEERGVLMEFVEDEQIREPIKDIGKEPKAEKVDKNSPVELVQKSQAQMVAKSSKAGVATTTQGDGDVEKYEPPRQDTINTRALFVSSNNKKRGEGEQTATESSDKLKAGNPTGNTNSGFITGEPTARIEGRSAVGKLPKPEYSVNDEGVVVVRIVVNSNGVVTSATAGHKGTTTQNATLWEAAKQAALKSKFSPKTQDPTPQEGTIIYRFKLK